MAKTRKLKTEAVPISTLHADPANVRLHSERNLASIKASLVKFGQQKPIVVGKGGVIIAGNGTFEAAKALGWKTIEVVRSSLTGAEATAYAIADNRLAELAEWDNDALAQVMASLRDDGSIDELVTGFDGAEIDGLFEGTAIPGPGDGDDGAAKTLSEELAVLVTCADESDQQAVFEKMKAEGRKCRILTM